MKLLELKNTKPFRVVEGDSVQIGHNEHGHKTFALDKYGKRFKDKLVLIDASLVERLWKNDSLYIGPGPEYNNSIGNRIENFKQYYRNNTQIDVGNAHVSARRNLMSFGDGRHRTRVLLELGYRFIPLQLSDDAIENLEQVYYDRNS